MWKEIIDQKKAAIFDLDGTIVDSMWVWKQIDIDYFGKCGMAIPEEYQKEIEGLSFVETAQYTHEKYIPDISVEQMMDDWNEMAVERYSHEVRPKDDVAVILKYMKSRGMKLGIATSNSRKLCEAALIANNMLDYFDEIITGQECSVGKPAPDVYILCAKALNVKPSDCLVFEDICNGIHAGNNAGMTTVAVHDRYSEYQWEEKCRLADHFIMSYKEIADEIYNA